MWAAVSPTTRPLPQILHLHLKRFQCWWNINISARANPFKCKCRIWGRGRGCRLHCSPHNLSLSVISSLGIIIAQKKFNRRETNRNKKPTNQQITTTTKAKKEDPPPPPPRPRVLYFPPSFAPPRREISHLRISLAQFTSVVTVMVSSWVGSLKMTFRSQRETEKTVCSEVYLWEKDKTLCHHCAFKEDMSHHGLHRWVLVLFWYPLASCAFNFINITICNLYLLSGYWA